MISNGETTNLAAIASGCSSTPTAAITGCLAGFVGVGLYLAGLIDKGWLLITLGLYLAGYFAKQRMIDKSALAA